MRLFYDGSYVVAQGNIREERLAQGMLKVKKVNIKEVMDWYTCPPIYNTFNLRYRVILSTFHIHISRQRQ